MLDMERHLRERHFDSARYSGVYVDTDRLTVGLWDLSGRLVGYQVYRPDRPKTRQDNPRDMRYFTFVSRYGGRAPALGVWGLETVTGRRPLLVCEGVFDACRLHQEGFDAVAVLGNNPRHLAGWLSLLPQTTVAVCDDDAAGRMLARVTDTAVHLRDGDAGSVSRGVLLEALSQFT